MKIGKTDIWVFAQWKGMKEPKCLGVLSAQQAKGRKSFGFEYNDGWIGSEAQFLLDPDIGWFTGGQFPNGKENFGVFTDSMPDSWGRKLMQRRAVQNARKNGKTAPQLYEIDFLLGVHDFTRMGALRFKLDPKGDFLDNEKSSAIPPWAHIRELQLSAKAFEEDTSDEETRNWLDILFAPGSSLGGARPKANILDHKQQLWIAKFPAKNDNIDKAAWEYLAYKLAKQSGVIMTECKLESIYGEFRTFFTQRFDRQGSERIHFSSAMTMTGNNEDLIRDSTPSYLEIAEFIQFSGGYIKEDLHQLWRRIIFNMAISNTDDHLRNHGFILNEKGWQLSPAYDLNPSVDKLGLALNVDSENNDLDFELAKSVGKYFNLNNSEMDEIISEVKEGTKNWRTLCETIGISQLEQELMAPAFALSNS